MIDSPQQDENPRLEVSRIASDQDFDSQPAVAAVETDRYCDGCGYNLRTQVVRRDARTGLLLSRCPECGRLETVREAATVGRVWLQRLGTLGLFLWIVVILSLTVGLGALQAGLTAIMLDELTTYRHTTSSAPAASTNLNLPQVYSSAGSITIIQPGSTMTVSRRAVREKDEYYALVMSLLHAGAFLTGFVMLMLYTVACHHWRKWGYLIPATVMPFLVGLLIWYAWTFECPHLSDWGRDRIIHLNAAFLAGGWTAILFGRAAARLIVRLLLPPRLQQVLAFLWLADGKPPPVSSVK